MMIELKSTKFMNTEEKARVLKQWETFLKYGCQEKHFTKPLYHHLINHCSFIAHYDRAGFYATYFESGEDTTHFLTQFDGSKGPPRSIEYGRTDWIAGGNDVSSEYYDINTAMCQIAVKYISGLTNQAKKRQEKADINEARRLLSKHGKASLTP